MSNTFILYRSNKWNSISKNKHQILQIIGLDMNNVTLQRIIIYTKNAYDIVNLFCDNIFHRAILHLRREARRSRGEVDIKHNIATIACLSKI